MSLVVVLQRAALHIDGIVETIRSEPNCRVWPAGGQPVVRDGHVPPDDLTRFYQLCGGLEMFPECYPVAILPPDKVWLANPVVTCIPEAELATWVTDDISWSWYVIAITDNGDHFSIDLSPERLGRCYNSFHETHALRRDTDIIAHTFTDFVEHMFHILQSCQSSGGYWEDKLNALRLGDAYDDVAE